MALAVGMVMIAALAGLGGAAWWRARDRPRILRVEALKAPTDDAAAQAIRVGFAADLARMVLENDARLVIEDPNTPASGAEPRADYVITGEARGVDGKLYANLHLLDGRGGAILWSRSYTRPIGEAEALRAEIAANAADVGICAEGGRQPPPGMDAETLRLYLAGCEQKHGDWVLGARLLGETVQRRPDFAHAWAMYADATASIAPDGPAGATVLRQADAYARRALALDPSEGEAWDARAEALPGAARWPERMAMLREGHRRDPDSAMIDIDLAADDFAVGWIGDAILMAKASSQRDPFSAVVAAQYIALLGLTGQVEAARDLVDEAGRRWPRDPSVARAWFNVLAIAGDPATARAMLDASTPDYKPSTQVAAAWRAVLSCRRNPNPGARAEAQRAILAITSSGPSEAENALVMSAAIGDLDGAYAYAARFPDRQMDNRQVLFYDAMAPFRADRRFMALAARQGLVEIWRRSGHWPDFCQKSDRPYDCVRAAAPF